MRWFVGFVVCAGLVACGDDDAPSCRSVFDCPGAQQCINGACVDPERVDAAAEDAGRDAASEDAGRDAAADGGVDANDVDAGGCPEGFVDVNGDPDDGCECPLMGDEVCDSAGQDENCDGTVNEGCDCVEGETRPCGSTTGACEAGVETCVDGVYGVCEGGVGPAEETCNVLDDDCDTAVDEDLACGPENTAARCTDGFDNDGDGFVDCMDFDCSRSFFITVCPETFDAICSDGIDNDRSGLRDCADPNCDAPGITVCGEGTDTYCSDGVDNDGDGFVDCMDFDCDDSPLCP